MTHTTLQDPWNILESMVVQMQKIARPLPPLLKAATWSGIALQVGDAKFFAPLNGISEILREPPITQIPGMKRWLLGITHVRGELLIISDLQDFLVGRNKGFSGKARIVVIRHEEDIYGLIVDCIFGLKHFSKEQHSEKITVDVSKAYLPFVKGQLQETDGSVWPLIDLREVVMTPDFYQTSLSGTLSDMQKGRG